MTRIQSLFILKLLLFCSSFSFSQNLDLHRWENRVLLLISNDSVEMSKQFDVLKKDRKGIKERKLIVYKIAPTYYEKGMDSTTPSKVFDKSYFVKFKTTTKALEVVLIGLDGGIKLRQTNPITLEKLFALIDKMPIRRSEIRKKQ